SHIRSSPSRSLSLPKEHLRLSLTAGTCGSCARRRLERRQFRETAVSANGGTQAHPLVQDSSSSRALDTTVSWSPLHSHGR
ncbi:unnamed protein product, partial [Scytosiphon promiscuus]